MLHPVAEHQFGGSAQLAVVRASGSAAIVRLPDDDPAKIKQALDIGAQSLLIPLVDSAEQAATAWLRQQCQARRLSAMVLPSKT